MASNAVKLANLLSGDGLTVDNQNDRVGVASTTPTTTLDVDGTVTATAFVGDGSELTGVSGFATALSTDQTSILNRIFKTPREINIGAGTSLKVTSDAASGDVAFCREGQIHVAVGSTFHVGSGTTFAMNVLGIF
tara:strand:+ start:30 stop:434 length:405 start_codon:yes stop_codon:yes gene_type:complete